MERKETNRGFYYYEFEAKDGTKCSIQESSNAMEKCIWLGADEIGLKKFIPYQGWEDVELLEQDHPYGITHVANNRVQLNQETVAKLIPLLQKFVDTGEL
jgi:hypothetical protein